MNVLNIYSDKEILVHESDAYYRHQKYAEMLDGKYFVHYIDKKNSVSQIGNINCISTNSNFFSIIINLIKIIKKENIDLIIIPRPFRAGIVGSILKLLTHKKILLSVYGSNIYRKEWFMESIKNFFFRFTIGGIIFNLSNYLQLDGLEDLELIRKKFLNKKVFWKPMIPANIKDFINIKKETRDFNILFIGRLVPQKNINLLCKIVSQTIKNNPSIKFNIVGDGLSGEKINNLVGIFPNNINWIKKVSRDDILNLYKKASALLLCSRYEGLPRVFMESAASGTPIITSRVSGIKNILEDSVSGYIIEQNKPAKEYRDRILHLYENRNKIIELGSMIKSDFINNFDLNITNIQQKEIFDYIKKQI